MKLITLDRAYAWYVLRLYYYKLGLKVQKFEFWQYCEYLKQEGYRIV